MLEALAISAVVLAMLLLAGALYHALGAAVDLRRHPPPGRLIDVGGHRLHHLSRGVGSPTVVFEAGLPGSVLSWTHVLPELARLVRVVAYDRAGLGWSDAGPEPRSAERIVAEWRTLLERAGIPPPYVLVGHSFGGLTARLFAARYPHEVAGLVLIDPIGPHEWAPLRERERRRLAAGAKLCRRTAWLARFGVARTVAALVRLGAYGLTRRAVSFLSTGLLSDASSTVGPLRKLPPAERSIAAMFWIQPKFYQAMASQIESIPQSAAELLRAGDRLEGKPVVVISAANTQPERLAEQLSIARLSSRGRHMFARQSGHWIQLDEPGLVTGAILEVIAELGRAPAPRVRSPLGPFLH